MKVSQTTGERRVMHVIDENTTVLTNQQFFLYKEVYLNSLWNVNRDFFVKENKYLSNP